MADDANHEAEYDAALLVAGAQLADVLVAALPGWFVARARAAVEAAGRPFTDELEGDAVAAAAAAVADIEPRLRALLSADVDEQRGTPLSVLREAVGPLTVVLDRHRVPPPARDRVAEEQFPDDLYDATPATFADFGAAALDAGIRWGAAKAFAHKARHRGPA